MELESPTTEPASVNRLMDLVQSQHEALDATVRRVPGRDGRGDHLVSRAPWGDDGPGILVLSHLDTVHPLDTLTGRLPFRVEGNGAWGPGIADMKGGAYMGYNALRHFAAKGEETPLPLTFLYNSDEETGSRTSKELIEEEGRKNKYVLVTEPGRNGGSVVTARKGSGRIRIRITGRPSHSGSHHELGRSALKELAHQILALEAMTDYDRGITVNVGIAGGGTRPNVVPGEAHAEVDMRADSAGDADEMLTRILALKSVDPDVTVEVEGQINRYPYRKSEGIEALYRHAVRLASEYDFPLPETHTGGGSDGNFTAALGIPTLDALGADGEGGHTYDEHIYVDKLVPRQTLLVRLMQTLT
ncbi:MAG: M20 family metallopeptidase [Acetobacterales bacterium]